MIRINGSYKIKTAEGADFVQLHLCDEGSYRQVMLGKHDPIEFLNVVIHAEAHHDEDNNRWLLATSLEDAEQAVADYRQRMWIEQTFKDLKSKLKWETYTRNLCRASRL